MRKLPLLVVLTVLALASTAQATIFNVTERHSSSSITIQWQSDVREFAPTLKFSADGTTCSLTQTASSTSDCLMVHSVTVSGLAAGVQYCLRPQGTFCSGLSLDLGNVIQVTTNTMDTPTSTATPTSTPTSTATPTATVTKTFTVSPTFTQSPTSTASPTPTVTKTVSPTKTATSTATPTSTSTSTATPTATPIAVYGNLRLVKDGGTLVSTGAGAYTVSMAYQPVQILRVYFQDLTADAYPNVGASVIYTTPQDYADAAVNSGLSFVVSYDTSKNLLVTVGSPAQLTSGHTYRVVVQYLTAS